VQVAGGAGYLLNFFSMLFVSPNSMAISVQLNTSSGITQSSTKFPTQDVLINRRIVAIESFCSTDAIYDPLNSGYVPMPPDVFNASYLTLYRSNNTGENKARKVALEARGIVTSKEPGLYYDMLPMFKTRTANNNYSGLNPQASFVNDIFIISPTCLNWQKCTVNFPTNVACASNVSACFYVHYLDEGDDGAWFEDKYFGSLRH
jgi:hypothetical protein